MPTWTKAVDSAVQTAIDMHPNIHRMLKDILKSVSGSNDTIAIDKANQAVQNVCDRCVKFIEAVKTAKKFYAHLSPNTERLDELLADYKKWKEDYLDACQ